MRLPRGLVVIAIVAALWGAPLPVSAAVNELSSPQVSPGGGSVTTVFTFRVRYDGGFGAAAVTVSVAGSTLPLVLESGSPTAGWWSGSTLLPSGAWSTSFRATATQGRSASVAGPVVIVSGLSPASPTQGPVAPPSSGATPESAPADGADGPTAPPAAPAPSTDGASTATAGPSSAPAAPAPNDAGGGSGGSDAPAQGGSASTPAPGGGDDAPPGQAAPAASPASSPAAGRGEPGVVQPAADRQPQSDTEAGDEMVSDVILVGLAGVASVAVIGTLFLIAGRRREPAQATVAPTPPVAGDRPPRALVRTGRAQPSDDPIVAALGVDDEMAARRAIRRAGRAGEDGRATKGPAGR